jgi:Lipid A 3-O-deacylase (PagL)
MGRRQNPPVWYSSSRRMGFRRASFVATLALALTCLGPSASSFAQDPGSVPSNRPSPSSETGDFNTDIYYKNKLEVSFDTGCLFLNTPLILDPILGDKFSREPGLPNYTLVPLISSLRWQLDDIGGRSFWRGNTDLTFGGAYNVITQGPESYYAALITGVRYNFVQPNWRIAPYLELRGGLGLTDARQPWEAAHHQPEVGQGQDFTFTFIVGGGVRYNFSPRYSASVGAAFMHISNAYLSEPKYYNHGINVFGPTFGLNVAL